MLASAGSAFHTLCLRSNQNPETKKHCTPYILHPPLSFVFSQDLGHASCIWSAVSHLSLASSRSRSVSRSLAYTSNTIPTLASAVCHVLCSIFQDPKGFRTLGFSIRDHLSSHHTLRPSENPAEISIQPFDWGNCMRGIPEMLDPRRTKGYAPTFQRSNFICTYKYCRVNGDAN